MPINPNISLAAKPLELADPLTQYGKLAAIQSAQNQNTLAQYQLSAAQRADEENQLIRNALAGKTPGTPEYRQAVLESFSKTGNVKGAQEFLKTEAEGDKSRVELGIKKMEMYRGRMGDLANNPSDQNIQAHLQDMLIARDITPEQAQERWQHVAGMSLPQRAKYFNDAAQTADQRIGHEITIRGQNLVDARARQQLEQDARSVVYQQDANGNVVALPSKLKKGEIPRAVTAVAPGAGMTPLQPKPSEAESTQRISLNQMKSTIKGALDAVEKNPDAFGLSRGLQGENLGGRLASSEENQARSYVFNVISGVIKERAGTAQSAAEHDTLMRFLPGEYDNAKQIEDKLQGFQKYLADKEAGTTKSRNFNPAGTPKPAAGGGKVAPPSGFVLDQP